MWHQNGSEYYTATCNLDNPQSRVYCEIISYHIVVVNRTTTADSLAIDAYGLLKLKTESKYNNKQKKYNKKYNKTIKLHL